MRVDENIRISTDHYTFEEGGINNRFMPSASTLASLERCPCDSGCDFRKHCSTKPPSIKVTCKQYNKWERSG